MFRNYRGNSAADPSTPQEANDRDDAIAIGMAAFSAAAQRDRLDPIPMPDISDELSDMLREAAAHDALVETPARREAEHANRLLKSRGATLEPIREKIRMSRKPRMRTVEQYLCDHCDAVIAKPTDGYIVHGNIYVAEPSCRGGLIGNNFPEVEPDEPIKLEAVKQTVFCKACFLKALGLEPAKAPCTVPKEWEGSSAVGRDSIRRNPYNSDGGNRSRY